jgi:4-amino-4-deoxy-L-arabinose transferase
MSYASFTTEQIIPLLISGIILIFSILTFRNNSRFSLALLFIGSLVLGFFIANLDSFLILWDEQYHALVAKNLSKNFLKPTLYADPVLDYSYKNWADNHVWLHKQPLFLWQMAVSIKLFGTTELAVRLPSIIMHAIIPLMMYRIGKIAVKKETGYIGALLFAVAYFPLELVAGRFSTDHNDVAFLFYVTGSFWAWFEYIRSKNKIWLLIIGLFSGSAVLVKWLMGLLVFVIWTFTVIISDFRKGLPLKSFLPILTSGIVSFVVFLPWQVYIHSNFPKEAAYEMQLNSRHFFEVIEDHYESTWYYFTSGFRKVYGSGDLIPFIFLFAVILLIVKIPKKEHKIFIAFGLSFVYSFYTMASTKMISFTTIVSPFIYLALGFLVYKILFFIKSKIRNLILEQTIFTSLLVLVLFIALNLPKIQNSHTDWKPNDNHNRIGQQIEMDFINSLDTKLADKDYVIFNALITVNGHIPILFYTDYVAYHVLPSPSQIEKLRKKNKKIAVLNLGVIPEYITQDKRIKLLEVENKELLILKPYLR